MKKILITTAIAATLLTTSMGVYAASNTNKNADAKPQIVYKANVPAISSDLSNSKGFIECTKITRADTISKDTTSVSMSSNNPINFDSRTHHINKANEELGNYVSEYTKDSGKSLVLLERDANGKPIGSEIQTVNEKAAKYNNSLFSKETSFSAMKANYASNKFTADGTIKTQDGKTLKKVSRTLKGFIKGSAETNLKETAYIDEVTGLPTKIELYQEIDGKMNLVNTQVYEFKYVPADAAEDIFDTNGVKQLPQFNYERNGVG